MEREIYFCSECGCYFECNDNIYAEVEPRAEEHKEIQDLYECENHVIKN